jgi:hypothetical protein
MAEYQGAYDEHIDHARQSQALTQTVQKLDPRELSTYQTNDYSTSSADSTGTSGADPSGAQTAHHQQETAHRRGKTLTGPEASSPRWFRSLQAVGRL